MKRLYLALLFNMVLACPIVCKAQYYNMVQTTESYHQLENPVYLTRSPFDPYDDNFTLPANFHFLFFGKDRYSFLVSKDGYVSTTLFEIMSPFKTFLRDNGKSSLSYELTGSQSCNNQILKIQWKNMGRFCDSSGSTSLNFQIWIYQTSNIFEFHYGNHSDTAKYFNICRQTDYGAFLQDSNQIISAKIDSFPDSGTVIRFVPHNEVDLNTIDFYPNPFQEQAYIQKAYGCDTLNIRVFDATGRMIFSKRFVSCPAEINTYAWNNGLYLVMVEDETGKIIQKLKVVKV
jgi:hypothetical protein